MFVSQQSSIENHALSLTPILKGHEDWPKINDWLVDTDMIGFDRRMRQRVSRHKDHKNSIQTIPQLNDYYDQKLHFRSKLYDMNHDASSFILFSNLKFIETKQRVN